MADRISQTSRTCAKIFHARNVFSNRFQVRCIQTGNNLLQTSGNDNLTSDNDDDELARKMNVSRLPKYLRNRMRHVMIPPDPTVAWNIGHLNPKYRQKLYAKYGQASGVHPGIHWPSKEMFAEIIKDEQDWEPTLQDMWETVATQKAEKLEYIAKRYH